MCKCIKSSHCTFYVAYNFICQLHPNKVEKNVKQAQAHLDHDSNVKYKSYFFTNRTNTEISTELEF